MLCDLPGKLGVGGAGVWDAWQKNDLDGIRRYCETDALLTYLLYARFQHFRGREDADVTDRRDRTACGRADDGYGDCVEQMPLPVENARP